MQDSNQNSNSMTAPVQFDDADELLDIRYDNIFKAVFTRDTPASKGALSGLISSLIMRKVIVETIITNEPPAESIFDRSIRYDIACRAETGELINIEMSFNPDFLEPVRLEYYISRHFSGQNIKGIDKNYSDLKETYQIAILGTRRFFLDEAIVHAFQYHDPVHDVSLKGKTRIVTMELKKAESIVEKPAFELDSQEAWTVFFQYLTDKSKRVIINEILKREAEIEMAGETLIHISQDEIEQARLTSELKYILDNQSMLVTARREGRAEGHAEGSAETRKAERQRFIELLDQGLTVEQIKEYLAEGESPNRLP